MHEQIQKFFIGWVPEIILFAEGDLRPIFSMLLCESYKLKIFEGGSVPQPPLDLCMN